MELEITPEMALEQAGKKLYYKIFEAVKLGLGSIYMLKGDVVPDCFYTDIVYVGNGVVRYSISSFAVRYGAAALSVLDDSKWYGVAHDWDTCQNYKGYKRKGGKERK